MKVYTVGLSGYGRRQPHDQSPGDACVEGRVFEKGRGVVWVLPSLHVCISYQLLKLQNYPVGLRSLSNVCCFPPLPGISKELPKRMQRTTLCDIYRHYSCYLIPDNISHILRFSVVMTDISVLRRNQFGSLNRWEREKNRRKLYWASHHIWHRNTNKLGNKGMHSYYKTPMRRERQQRLLNN